MEAGGRQEMLRVRCDTNEAAANGPSGDEGGARSAGWIEDDAVRLAERANERFQRLRRLLRPERLIFCGAQ